MRDPNATVEMWCSNATGVFGMRSSCGMSKRQTLRRIISCHRNHPPTSTHSKQNTNNGTASAAMHHRPILHTRPVAWVELCMYPSKRRCENCHITKFRLAFHLRCCLVDRKIRLQYFRLAKCSIAAMHAMRESGSISLFSHNWELCMTCNDVCKWSVY